MLDFQYNDVHVIPHELADTLDHGLLPSQMTHIKGVAKAFEEFEQIMCQCDLRDDVLLRDVIICMFRIVYRWDNTQFGGTPMEEKYRQQYSNVFRAFSQLMKQAEDTENSAIKELASMLTYRGTLFRVLVTHDPEEIAFSELWYSHTSAHSLRFPCQNKTLCVVQSKTADLPGISVAGIYRAFSKAYNTTVSDRKEHEVIYTMNRDNVIKVLSEAELCVEKDVVRIPRTRKKQT